jgi:2',3'-cyclic-nucleotide 2'-phosphodiesterase (5'-nucleotidase family)
MYAVLGRGLALIALAALPAFPEVRPLTILHVNDLHARLMPLENGHGGFARLASLIQRERANCPECILLHAGDVAQGSPVSTIFHGLPVFEIANLFGFDAGTLGNHEFDYGWMQARKFVSVSNYPIVSANIAGAKGELLTPKPYVILKVNGLRVAVIGGMTDSLKSLSKPALLEEWHTIPVAETVQKYARELRPLSDLVILLAHISPEEELRILKTVPEIPVLVTGHAHTGLPQPLIQDGRILVRVKGYAEELGRLELRVDTEKKAAVAWDWKHILVDSSIAPRPDVAAVVKKWEDEVAARVDRPLAVSKRAFNKREVKALIETALREETGADFAHMNLGGVRDTLPEGQLLERHIWNIMPFDNRIVFGKFKGRELPTVVVGDRKVDPDHIYTLAVSDYTAENQQTSENLRTTGLKFPGDGGLMRDVLIDWFRKKKVIE